jgi:hypothetical protein
MGPLSIGAYFQSVPEDCADEAAYRVLRIYEPRLYAVRMTY